MSRGTRPARRTAAGGPRRSAAPPGVEVAELLRSGPEGAAELLIEVPHGATERRHFDELARRLRGPLPAGLAAFFHVNTDEGAPELAAAIAAALPHRRVVVLRALAPRTFVDFNRVVEDGVAAGMTAGLPAYLRDPADRSFLLALHARYTELAAAVYAETCGAGGLALALHTFAPRSVEVAVDDEIVRALRRAYRPDRRDGWPLRPPVDLITRTPEGEELAPEGLKRRLREALGPLGLGPAENATYALHPATTGHHHAKRHPGQVLCLEVRRDLLGAPWRPFVESRIGPRKCARVARPIATALDDELDVRQSSTESA